MKYVEEYFRTARDREFIRLYKEHRLPPLAQHLSGVDPVLSAWHFCNVHREHDFVTKHLRVLTNRMLAAKSKISITQAVIAYRWFNRPETCDRIIDLLEHGWDSGEALDRLQDVHPVVTGAYIINGLPGYDKLNGVLAAIDQAFQHFDASVVNAWTTLEGAWEFLTHIPHLGGFMAYEIVSDLRWTPVLWDASDRMTWANAGPGCARGLSRVVDGSTDLFSTSRRDQVSMLTIMRELLEMSWTARYWPSEFRPWEMREVEHWSCEFDKYQRAAVEGKRLKRRYRPRS